MRLRIDVVLTCLLLMALLIAQGAPAQEPADADHLGHDHHLESILDELTPQERENYTSQTLIAKLSEKSSLDKKWKDLGEDYKGLDLRLGTRSDDLQKGDKVTLHTRIYSPAGDILLNSYEHGPTVFYMGYNHDVAAGQVDLERMIKGMKAGGKRLIVIPAESNFAKKITQKSLRLNPPPNLGESDDLIVEAVIFHVRRPDLTKKFDYQ